MSNTSIEEILELDGEGRFEIFLSMVADEREVWVLINEDDEFLKIYSDEHDLEYLPVWPHADLAVNQVKHSSEKLKPMSITVPLFFSKWVPGLEGDNIQVGVLPGNGDDVFIMPAPELKDELQDEFSNFGL